MKRKTQETKKCVSDLGVLFLFIISLKGFLLREITFTFSDFVLLEKVQNMMPVKDILAMRPHIPGPPVLVIDETSIEQCHDAGPVCGCHEKYQMIQNYSPFLPGGINPYNKKRKISESDCFDVTWKNIKIGSHDLLLEKPFARHICELPSNREVKKNGQNDEDFMHITPPRYTEAYHRQKMRECPREHYENCDCFIRNSGKE